MTLPAADGWAEALTGAFGPQAAVETPRIMARKSCRTAYGLIYRFHAPRFGGKSMKIAKYICYFSCLYLISGSPSLSQWKPEGSLLDIARVNNCSATGGRIAVVKPDAIYYCPARASLIDTQVRDASHFYFVHAYGFLYIHRRSQKLADCWAAHALAGAPNGPHYVRQWMKHWQAFGRTDQTYGTPEQRIANVRSCCACGV